MKDETEQEVSAATGEPERRFVILAAVAEPGGSRVVELAARLTRRAWSEADLHVIHVFRSGPFDRAPPGGVVSDELAEDARLLLQHHVRMATRQCSTPVKGHFATGSPVKEIVKAARALHADLVVLGREHRSTLDRLLMGSVAEGVLRALSCSVVVAGASGARVEPTDRGVDRGRPGATSRFDRGDP
jgi:nucleotide-binding universal stress UspA family protein